MYSHVIFDLDGTLIDSAPSILKCLTLALRQNKIDPVTPLTNQIIGPPLDVTLKRVTGITDNSIINNLINCFKNAYDSDGYKDSVPYHGVEDMLRKIAGSGIDVYLATNKRILPTRKILEHFSWAPFFNSVYALDVGDIKFNSKSEMLASMVKGQNLDPLCSIYVGDINADYEAAQKSNMQFIFAEWGYEKSGIFEYPLTASSVSDLTEKILN